MERLTPADVAKRTGKSKAAVLHWIRAGKLKAEEVDTGRGRGYLVDADELQRFLGTKSPAAPRQQRTDQANTETIAAINEAHRATVAAKNETIQRMADEIEHLRQQLNQAHTLIAQAQARIPALPEPGTESPRRSWWPWKK